MHIFIALDDLSREEILQLADEFAGEAMFKINDGFLKYGLDLINQLGMKGCKIFLDCKWNDIPNTVANYIKFIANLDVIDHIYCFTIHCNGGYEMMKTAADTLRNYFPENDNKEKIKPKIFGITVLTSFTENSLCKDLLYGSDTSLKDLVIHYAKNAQKAGLDGVVCSPEEISVVKTVCGNSFITVTPGIRPLWAVNKDDQKRVMSPYEAMKAGTDYLIIGRPLLQAHKFNLTRREAFEKLYIESIKGRNAYEKAKLIKNFLL